MNQIKNIIAIRSLNRHNFKKTGFTLAEVLITLAVIGVVAALVIPTLIVNYQKSQVESSLKKVFAVISQGVQLSILENGRASSWNLPVASSNAETNRIVDDYIKPYLKYTLDCPAGNSTGECSRYLTYYLDDRSYTSPNAYLLSLNDGINLTISSVNSSVYFVIDLNGAKLPNKKGRDIFFMILYPTDTTVDFYGAKKRTRDGLKTDPLWGCELSGPTQAGDFCGALIQMDGWQISSDYPW